MRFKHTQPRRVHIVIHVHIYASLLVENNGTLIYGANLSEPQLSTSN